MTEFDFYLEVRNNCQFYTIVYPVVHGSDKIYWIQMIRIFFIMITKREKATCHSYKKQGFKKLKVYIDNYRMF